jgi:hypothetical protein
LLPKTIKIKTYRTITLLVVLYRCEICPLILREECRLREFETRVQRRIFGPKRDEVTGKWTKPHNDELNDLYSSPNIIQVLRERRMRLLGGREKVHTGFWWGNLRERDHLEDPTVDERIIVRWIFRKWDWGGGRVRPVSIGFRIETCGGHL